jgi:hypothetical protein
MNRFRGTRTEASPAAIGIGIGKIDQHFVGGDRLKLSLGTEIAFCKAPTLGELSA